MKLRLLTLAFAACDIAHGAAFACIVRPITRLRERVWIAVTRENLRSCNLRAVSRDQFDT